MRHFAFKLITLACVLGLVTIKLACDESDKHYGWAVGVFTGLFLGAFGVALGGDIERHLGSDRRSTS